MEDDCELGEAFFVHNCRKDVERSNDTDDCWERIRGALGRKRAVYFFPGNAHISIIAITTHRCKIHRLLKARGCACGYGRHQ